VLTDDGERRHGPESSGRWRWTRGQGGGVGGEGAVLGRLAKERNGGGGGETQRRWGSAILNLEVGGGTVGCSTR
jgi:hypothetical protein